MRSGNKTINQVGSQYVIAKNLNNVTKSGFTVLYIKKIGAFNSGLT